MPEAVEGEIGVDWGEERNVWFRMKTEGVGVEAPAAVGGRAEEVPSCGVSPKTRAIGRSMPG